MLKNAQKAVDKMGKNMDRMIKVSEEIIPRNDNILSPKHAVEQTKEETKKILGQPKGEVISNKYLKRIKDFVGDGL